MDILVLNILFESKIYILIQKIIDWVLRVFSTSVIPINHIYKYL